MSKTILNINQVHEVENYPYGRLKTKAFFSIEFQPKKGFRSVFQTINPKNNRLNNPKKYTYSPFLCNFINEENGHIEEMGFGFRSFEGINHGGLFLTTQFDALQLKPEMIKYLCKHMSIMLKANARYTNADKDKMNKLIKPTEDLLVHGLKTGDNVFGQIKLDVAGIKQLEEEPSWLFL